MRVGTYPTRNFATLGPSELRPPFTGASSQCLHTSSSPSSTGQVSDPIRHLTILQSLVFLLNSRPSLFGVTSRTFGSIGTPSSEVTEPFCRVPSTCFSQAP